MQILAFRVRNHKSLRDDTSLELTTPKFEDLDFTNESAREEYMFPVAGVFGANASGKSNLLDALQAMIEGIGTVSRERIAAVHTDFSRSVPFALDAASREAETAYELEFALGGIFYRYGYSLDKSQITEEYLYAYKSSEWQPIFTRENGHKPEYTEGINDVLAGAHQLVLTRALELGKDNVDKVLYTVATALVTKIKFMLPSDISRDERIRDLIAVSPAGSPVYEDLSALVQIADTGITQVDLVTREMLADNEEAFWDVIGRTTPDVTATYHKKAGSKDPGEVRSQRLEFTHSGPGNQSPPLKLYQQSSGTVAWLAASTILLNALRKGEVVVADELDASLHPQLVRMIIQVFCDPQVNQKGAQLIFTTHDATLLGAYEELGMQPQQLWFTQKDRDGATELYSLADFDELDNNLELGYMTGKYGAVPITMPLAFGALVRAGFEQEDAE